MYQGFYKLRALPFELAPDPKYLFLTPRHREALSSIEYGLAAAKSLTLILGEAGTGKTTLLRAALELERCRHVKCVSISNPALTREEFLDTLAMRFDLGIGASQSKSVLLHELERVLRERRARGEIVALIVDEAQRLSTDLLEEVRLLGNIETATEKLLPLVLAGQPELGARLEEIDLRQLKQRVALRCEIPPFELHETAAYIASRIQTAGGVPSHLFTQEAVRLIHERSSGIPRTISVICDNSLVTGMALARQPVDREIVLEVCRDLCLHRARPAVSQASLIASRARMEAGEDPNEDGQPEWPAELSGRREQMLDGNPGSRVRRFSMFGPGWQRVDKRDAGGRR